jgi:Arc/MetJ-type ribon-helix-helix transcriptional regulator
MKYDHDSSRRGPKVTELVQVYLDQRDLHRLEQLTQQLGTTKSGVLREALRALERQLTDTAHHPALGVIGIAPEDSGPRVAYDVAREHDRYFADLEDASSTKRTKPKKRAR